MEAYTSALHFRRRESIHPTRHGRSLNLQSDPTRNKRARSIDHVDIPTIKLVQQGIGVDQGVITNREVYGSYKRPSDFTLTCIGYMIGIHNFFRLPHLCYKFGGGFIIAFIIMLIFLGTPVIFLELSVGQYYSVGIREAFGEMAPIMTGTSLLLTWNSLITCIMYTMIETWIRVYSGVSTSCLKPWEHCDHRHYFNTEYCYTGNDDDECNDLKLDMEVDHIFPGEYNEIPGGNHRLHYNYKCVHLKTFCNSHSWTAGVNQSCIDLVTKKSYSVYKRRIHSATEYFYGAVCGMERRMEELKRNLSVELERDIRNDPNNKKGISKEEIEEKIREKLTDPQYTEMYWTKENQKLQPDIQSSSGRDLRIFAITTWVIFGALLFEGLLSMTVFTYIINGIPFLILFTMTYLAVTFENSIVGVKQLIYGKKLLSSLWNLEMWAEAVLQVIITTGIGNGVLISLATFNKLHHGFLFDVLFTILLNVVTSICATLIAFCTIGHVISEYRIQVDFFEFIKTESLTSSVEFGYIVYTHFLTVIAERRVMILLFFFMTTSFTTDSCLRMIQNLLDTLVSIFPRLRPHPTAALLGICFFGLLIGFPMTKSGGLIFYVDYEYYLLRFIFPIILFVEVAGVCWIYRARRLLDNAELMEVVHNRVLLWYFWICLEIFAPFALVATVVFNFYNHTTDRFNYRKESVANIHKLEYFGIIFVSMPLALWILGIIDHVLQLDDLRDWKKIFHSHEDKQLHQHHRLSNANQGNQMDLILNNRAVINMEEEKHMKALERALQDRRRTISRKSLKLVKSRKFSAHVHIERKPEVIEKEIVVREAKELNKDILNKIVFVRGDTGLKIKKEIVEKLLFSRDHKGTLKLKKDILRKVLFRRCENGKLRICNRLFGNMVLCQNVGNLGRLCIRKYDLESLVTQKNNEGHMQLNKHLLVQLKRKIDDATTDEAKVDKILNVLGLITLFPTPQGQTKMAVQYLRSLILRKRKDGKICIKKKLVSKLLLSRKYYTGHTFVRKCHIRNFVCRKNKIDGPLFLKRNQFGKLLFKRHSKELKLNNYFIRTVALRETPHSLSHKELSKVRKFLVKAGADVKLWSDSPIYRKLKKSNGKLILGKKLMEKLKLRKLSEDKCQISRHLLKKLKRKGNLNIGKHTTTKLKLAKYPFEKFYAFNDAFGRLKRDNTGGLKLKKLVAVLKILRRLFRADHRHFGSFRDHVVDRRTKMDIWVEKILKHFEEWPGRLDDHYMDTEDSSDDSDGSTNYRKIHKTRLNQMGRRELQHELQILK